MTAAPSFPLNQASQEAHPRKPKRPPVSLDEVRSAYVELARDGHTPTLEELLLRVGGSKTTIVRHLEALRSEAQAGPEAEPSAVSPHVIRALATDIERVVKERTGLLEGRLFESQASLKVLLAECEVLQVSSVETDELLETLRASLAQQSGVVQALQNELVGKTEQIAASQADAESARQALVLSEARLTASEERCGVADDTATILRKELVDARRDLQSANLEVESSRGATAALQAQLSAKQQVEGFLRAAADEGSRYRLELEESSRKLAAREAECASLHERLEEVKDALSRSNRHLQQVLEKLLDEDTRDLKGAQSTPRSA